MKISNIVDMHGQPIKFQERVQTENDSRLAPLHKHFSEHPSSGLTPAKASNILKAAEEGDLVAQADLAEDMEEKDAHIQSEISKRRNAILTVDWKIKPPNDATPEEQRDAEMLEEILRDAMWLDDCLFDATDAILKGFSCQEIEWEPQLIGGMKLIKNVHWRDPAWFMTPENARNVLHLRDGSKNGIELQPFGWVKHIVKSKTGYLSRIGLVRTLVFPFIFKNYSVRDFAEFLEIYGLPMRLGKYPEGATQNEKTTLLRAVMGIGHNAGGIIPRGMEIEFQDAANGNAETFMEMIAWAERSMSKAILGGTLTSQADGKTATNALGSVHNDVRLEVRDSDLRRLQATITRDLVYPLYALNCKSYNDSRRIPRFEFETVESEDANKFAYSLAKLVGAGLKIPVEWAHKKLQIPMAKDGEEILEIVDQSSLATLSAKHKPHNMAILSAQPDPEVLLDKLEPTPEQYQQIIDPMLKPVIEAIEQGGYEFAQQRIATLYAEMDDTQLEETLARAIFVSDMLGRLNADK